MIRDTVQTIPISLPTGTDQLIVTVTLGETPYYGHTYYATTNKTVSEIFTAYLAGKDIYALVNGQYLPFAGGNAGHVRFYITQDAADVLSKISIIGIDDPNGDVWTYEATRSALDNDGGVTDYDLDGGTP